MSRALWRKTFGESKWLLLACTLLLFAFCWLRVYIVSMFSLKQFKTILDQFRAFEQFSPVPFDQLATYAGRIAMTYDEPMVVLIVVIWGITRGSDSVSGEIGRGTMEMLLAQPVRRLQLLLINSAMMVGGVLVLCAAIWLGAWAGIQTTVVRTMPEVQVASYNFLLFKVEFPMIEQTTEPEEVPMSELVSAVDLLPGVANLICLGFFISGLSTCMSSWDRYRWRTIAIVAGIYVIQFAMWVLAMSSKTFNLLVPFTFFSAYQPAHFVVREQNKPGSAWEFFLRDAQEQIVGLGPLGCNMLFLAMGIVLFAAAAYIFKHRDLPAPL